ncbi:polysaccharide deacetylase family protein [Haladaptatus sp. CMAA 1911]|uniref:polysaccharide deacetylase family protein n=1 Tax=unclassified Haladaptatus TaxID=2622732 RepID=UPI00375496A2
MSRQTRRAFLRTVGAIGTVSLAGCTVFGDSNEETSAPNQSSTTANRGTTSAQETQTPEEKTTTSSDSQGVPKAFENFESLGSWSAVDGLGTLKKGTKQVYAGSQSAHVIGGKQSIEGQIHRVNFASNPADFSNKNLSLAFKCTSHDFVKVAVQLYAPDQGHIVELKRTLYGPKGKWVRVNLGVTDVQRQQSVDLSNVYEVRIIGRPEDPNSTTPIDFYVDDVKTVPAPKKGMVMLTFDDSLESHYSVAYKKHMKKHGFPGVDAVITDAIYDDGFLTQPQMREMVKDGWDMIAHPNIGAKPFPQYPPKKQEEIMTESKSWLKRYGYDGHKYMAVPKNIVGPKTFDLAQKHFDLTLSFGASPNALPIIEKDTILSRMYGDGNIARTKQMVDYAATYKQLSVFLFHKIGAGGFSEKKFESLLQYIKQSNVEVVTLTDLAKKGLFI